MTTETIRFTAGETYTTRLTSDSQCILKFTVLSRTAKQVTIKEEGETPVRRGIEIYEGVETCYPFGKYSMSTILRANRKE